MNFFNKDNFPENKKGVVGVDAYANQRSKPLKEAEIVKFNELITKLQGSQSRVLSAKIMLELIASGFPIEEIRKAQAKLNDDSTLSGGAE